MNNDEINNIKDNALNISDFYNNEYISIKQLRDIFNKDVLSVINFDEFIDDFNKRSDVIDNYKAYIMSGCVSHDRIIFNIYLKNKEMDSISFISIIKERNKYPYINYVKDNNNKLFNYANYYITVSYLCEKLETLENLYDKSNLTCDMLTDLNDPCFSINYSLNVFPFNITFSIDEDEGLITNLEPLDDFKSTLNGQYDDFKELVNRNKKTFEEYIRININELPEMYQILINEELNDIKKLEKK